MKKIFKMKNDHLEVTVTTGDKIWLPQEDGGKVFIGSFEQKTIQKIDKEHAKTLRDFIQKEYDKGNGQLNALNKQLEPLKDVTDIDPEVVQAVKKQIGKGTKVFKQKMLVLNNHIESVQRKTQIIAQISVIQKEMDRMTKELKDIKTAIK